jgi:recombination protein RecR
MDNLPLPLKQLSDEIAKLPGVGRKTAMRIAFHLAETTDKTVTRLQDTLRQVREQLQLCEACGGFSQHKICKICSDETRQKELICVVEQARDILSIEQTAHYRGLYHVLGGVIAPIDGINPEDLAIEKLEERVARSGVKEMFLALNLSPEAEITALYLSKKFKPKGVKLTRLAQGLPMGTHLAYADTYTLTKSIEERRELVG